jgi:hypothetical protein
MGLFWDLMQSSEISANVEKTNTLAGRVRQLEHELRNTNDRLNEVIRRLEKRIGEDIDRDGLVG